MKKSPKPTNMKSSTLMERTSIHQLLFFGAIVRLVLLMYSVFHDHHFRVKYTDIDYMIIVDGAKEMLEGGSPFDRATYRYTPLLAVLVMPAALIANPLGKVVFTLCDLGAAYYCYSVLQDYATSRSAKWLVSLFILFNPIVLNVSTRGNSDMVITFLSMVVLAKFAKGKYATAAAILGFAVHFKIYPIIYAAPLAFGVLYHTEAPTSLERVMKALQTLIVCGISCIAAFAVPTILCYLWFGQQYLDEAFLYHIHREDHRHNFSPYWLLMYLNMGRRALGVGIDYSGGLFAFIPQAVVLLYTSWRLRRNVAHACCVETILFVAFNKVCTVQYFVWFIPFFPFVFYTSYREKPEQSVVLTDASAHCPSVVGGVAALTLWGLTIPLWMSVAYPLEFQGQNNFGRLWCVSCVFYLATVMLAAYLGRICRKKQEADAVSSARRLI